MKALGIFLLLFFYLLGSGSEPLAFFFLILYLAYLAGVSRSPGAIGDYGERKVRKKIESFIRKNNEYILFNDLTLEALDGTTQVDHVLISPYGIFVIETKNFKGWVFGSENQKMWTQTLYHKKYKFQNPLRQNYKHIKAVQNLLGVNMKSIFSIVVFVGDSSFRTAMPHNVLVLSQLIPFIASHNQKIISSGNIKAYSQKLEKPTFNTFENQNIHKNDVEQNKKKQVCPICGKTMVIRTASRGRSTGEKFWGCSGFPACKATKNI